MNTDKLVKAIQIIVKEEIKAVLPTLVKEGVKAEMKKMLKENSNDINPDKKIQLQSMTRCPKFSPFFNYLRLDTIEHRTKTLLRYYTYK